jgi:putative solute:sodium symporter small subunit
MTVVLLAIWFVVSYVVAYFAIPINQISFFGFPLAFYVGAQGALIVYVLIIFLYARYMNKLDRDYGVAED